ncbi:MAG: GNAT family N-acetyltransferase [Alphaproteobacteria bacterium]
MSETSKFYDVPAGKIAAVVTYLEMRSAPPVDEEPASAPGELRRINDPDSDWYLELYRRIGIDFLWFSRLTLPEDALSLILTDPKYEIFALRCQGKDKALFELDFRNEGECELSFFGVVPSLVGTGAGRALMARAIEIAWSRPINRFWLHTCTLDHPKALQFYLRAGFTAFKREIEIADDPRLTGALRRDATPDVPIIEG